MKESLKEALEKFREKRILVVGDVMLDKFSEGKVIKINPEQPAATSLVH